MTSPETAPPRHLVFDIDGVLVFPVGYSVEEHLARYQEALGADFMRRHTIEALGYPHLVFPGVEALLRRLSARGVTLHVFSSGRADRNIELIGKLMERAFPDASDRPRVPLYHRHDCLDTSLLGHEDPEGSRAVQGLWHGLRKKPLAGKVVPPTEVADTLLIDDDKTYAVAGEEPNMVLAKDSLSYCPAGSNDHKGFISFHKAYYLAALLEDIFARADERRLRLAEAAVQVQVTDLGDKLDSRCYFIRSCTRIELYERGLEMLREDDPSLRLYFDVPSFAKDM